MVSSWALGRSSVKIRGIRSMTPIAMQLKMKDVVVAAALRLLAPWNSRMLSENIGLGAKPGVRFLLGRTAAPARPAGFTSFTSGS